MTLLYLDDSMSNHRTGVHPECPERIVRLNRLLRDHGWTEKARCPSWENATLEELKLVHGEDYLEQLQAWDSSDAGRVEEDTVVNRGSWGAAVRGVGASCDAVRRILAGEDRVAFCAIRPPGHHALVDTPMGFCLLNNIAIAARYALQHGGLDRVLIIDWDVHHGNGTQDVFWEDSRVAFYSSHRFPFYPGSGRKDETGAGKGLGFTCNLPVKAEISRKEFFEAFTNTLTSFADQVKPQLVLVSAGFDAHRADPVGGLCLEEDDFSELTKLIVAIAKNHAQGRIVSLLEGGYHLEHMPQSARVHLQTLHETVAN